MNTTGNAVIPLTEDMFEYSPSGDMKHNENLYYHCGFIRNLVPQVVIDYNKNYIYYLTNQKDDKEMRSYFNVDRKTYRGIRDIHREVRFFEGFVVLMPFEVGDKLYKAVKNKTTREKKTIVRLYLYLYYWAMRNLGSYTHARMSIALTLMMNWDNITKDTDYLESCGLLRKGDYSVLDSCRRARTYFIPEELWTDRCRYEVDQVSIRTKNK